MRPVRLLLIYFISVFLGAALIAPWIYQLVQSVSTHYPVFEKLANNPLHRFVNRALLLFAFLGLWPFLRSLGIRTWKDLGFAPLALHWKNGVAGFFIGLSSLAALAAMALSFGARTFDLDHSGGELVAELLGATVAAIVVAVLEECLFRGAIFGALRKSNSWPCALVVSSAIYALLHFFGKPKSPDSVQWTSGLVTLAGMFGGFANLKMLVPKFFNLFIVGAILGLAFQRTGNLYFSIGLHAGWIFWLRSYGTLTNKAPEISSWLWGSGKMIDGWLATAVLLGVFGFLFNRRQNSNSIFNAA